LDRIDPKTVDLTQRRRTPPGAPAPARRHDTRSVTRVQTGQDQDMRFRLGFFIGFGAGYWFGAKAGRQRYEQMERWVTRAKRSEAFETATDKAKAVVDLGKERARDMIDRGKSEESDLVDVTESGDARRTPRGNGASTVTTPSSGAPVSGMTESSVPPAAHPPPG
jgi:hypothetical protein